MMTGFFNTGLDFLLLNVMVFLFGAYPLVANTISVTIGITISYMLNHLFVFRSEGRLSIKKYLTFFAVTGFSSLVIQNSIIFGFEMAGNAQIGHTIPLVATIMDNDGIRLNLAKVTAVGVGMIWNFTLYKFVVFKKRNHSDKNEPEAEEA